MNNMLLYCRRMSTVMHTYAANITMLLVERAAPDVSMSVELDDGAPFALPVEEVEDIVELEPPTGVAVHWH